MDFYSEKIHVVLTTEDGKKIAEKNTTIAELGTLGTAWLVIGMDSKLESVKAAIDKLGITVKDHDELKMKRLLDRPVWEWGETAILDIEKDEFLLAGFKTPDQFSLNVEAYTLPGATLRFPKVIRFRKPGPVGPTDVFSYEMLKYKSNVLSPQHGNFKPAAGLDPVLSENANEWLSLVR